MWVVGVAGERPTSGKRASRNMGAIDTKEAVASTETGSGPGAAGRPYFTLRYKHGVDAQGRVQFPSRWKGRASGTTLVAVLREMTVAVPSRANPSISDRRVLRYLEVMPSGMFEEHYEEVMRACSNESARQAARRRFSWRMVELDFDGAGRFSLPEELKGPAELKGTAWLVGCVHKFQIWSPEHLECADADDAHVLAKENLDW